MSTATAPQSDSLPASLSALEHQAARNFIGGRWQFPAAPYEYEIRNPANSDIIAVVPLSSRFDVSDAVGAARGALTTVSQDRGARARKLRKLLDDIAARQGEFAELQSLETGLAYDDSLAVVRHTVGRARSLLSCDALSRIPQTGGVSGHILSWGLPFTEIMSSVMPALVAGDAVVVKPSLRAPLSAVAFAHVAGLSGIEPGLVNIVQGTGGDVGAELISRGDLTQLNVRGGRRTVAAARRARTGVPVTTLSIGHNVVIVGAAAMVDVARLARGVGNLVRLGGAAGPLTLPLVAVERGSEDELVSALIEELDSLSPAPVPTEALRDRAQMGIRTLVEDGATAVLDGTLVPDDIPHRMGWRLRPTLLRLGPVTSQASLRMVADAPQAPVLGVATFGDPSELARAFAGTPSEGSVARFQGVDPELAAGLPHGSVVSAPMSGDLTSDLHLAPAWFQCPR